MTLKIYSWNVNGLRAVLNRNGMDWQAEHCPDVLCLQEIKTRPEQLTGPQLRIFDGQWACWNPAERAGYSGVATFSRVHPSEASLGMGLPDFDSEGRVIQTQFPGFLLFNIYFPNGQRDLGRLAYKLDFYAELLEICDKLHQRGEKIILCGDFNTSHREIDLRNPKQNVNTSGFMPVERAWIDKYLTHGFRDAYRELYPERVQYTWWTYRMKARERNIGWRLDYFLVSDDLMPAVKDVVIHEEIGGSDHCPVALHLEDSPKRFE
jgi:exodeoxyribonuclease III